MRIFLIFAFFSAVCQLSQQASLPSGTHYIAGVVEFQPSAALDDNLSGYLEIIASEDAAATDIIVFPEMTLNPTVLTYVPAAALSIAPCSENGSAVEGGAIYESFLQQLSCAARNVSKYIVVNLSEKEDCLSAALDPRPCSSTGYNVFNTNVVFDREGRVISRYRKVHLYGEAKNTTYIPEYGYFDTDFGVRFGHFVCFDILFYAPAQEMADKYGIRDFIFPTMWYSQLPFLTAVQIQAAWAYGNDVNFLTAGASNPLRGSTGSGIYAGRRGALVAVMKTALGERQLYVARVPKKTSVRETRAKRDVATQAGSASRLSITADLLLLKRDYLQTYESVPLDLSQGTNLTRNLCFNGTLCCHFELSWRHLEDVAVDSRYYTYRLGVLDSMRNEAAAETNFLKNCALFACTGEDIMDCGQVLSTDGGSVQPQVAFERILIEVELPKSSEVLLMPNSVTDDMMPVPVDHFEWTITANGSNQVVRYVLNTTTDNLLAFAVYGNYFDGVEDSDNDGDDDGAASTSVSMYLVLVAVALSFFSSN